MRLQSIVKTLHIWFGLICGSLLCITCLSGSIAVFRPQIEAALSPKVVPSPARVDLEQATKSVLAQNPGARISRVLLPTQDRNTFVLTIESRGEGSRRIAVDAGTGAVAGQVNVAWLDWVIDLHHNLLAGKAGRRVVGVAGIVLFMMSLTGLALSLLRGASWKALFKISAAGPRRRFYFELHRATGLWTYALLTVLSFTGIALAFPEPFRAVLGQRTQLSRPEEAGESFRPLKDYLEIGQATLPQAQLTELRIPKSPKEAISVRFQLAGDIGEIGRNELSLDARGNVLGIRSSASEPAGVRVQSCFTPIHYGEVGGITVRVLWSLAGVAPLGLYITGFLVWFRKKTRANTKKEDVPDEFLVTRESF